METSASNTGPLGQPRGIGFAILMLVPSLTMGDNIGTPIHVEAPAPEHTGH